MKRCIKKKLLGFVIEFIHVPVCVRWSQDISCRHCLAFTPCTYHLLHWMYIMYNYILHCDKSSVVFQVSHFHVAFSCLAPVGQENPCLFRQRVMKWIYTLRLCLPRTSSASRSMSSVHLLLLGKIRPHIWQVIWLTL